MSSIVSERMLCSDRSATYTNQLDTAVRILQKSTKTERMYFTFKPLYRILWRDSYLESDAVGDVIYFLRERDVDVVLGSPKSEGMHH